MSAAVIKYYRHMVRWAPGAGERLAEAALALYAERGYDQTTVAEIAARAGVTERTFFRYFADKREVLFAGSHMLEDRFVSALAGAPADATPIEAMAVALDAVGAEFRPIEYARARHAVIASHPELQERELIKLAKLAAALAVALRQRGVAEPAASLAAEAGVAIFKVAFERWVTTEGRGLADHMREALADLRSVTAI